ncbi:MAG: hypothetical protein AAB116_21650 [Candidatus Poribacteria bacterium]
MNRKLALILSLVYCGLGQIYKGEAWKGFSFAIIYTTLGLSLIFMAPTLPLAQLLLIFLLICMWFTGMIDAYANDETFIESNHGLLWKTLIMVLIVIGIFGSIVTVTLLVVLPQIFAYDSGIIDSNSNKIIGSSQPMEEALSKRLVAPTNAIVAQTNAPAKITDATLSICSKHMSTTLKSFLRSFFHSNSGNRQ